MKIKRFKDNREAGDPWTTRFIYIHDAEYMLVGWNSKVEKWIENNLKHTEYLERYDYWKNKVNRGSWVIHNTPIHITPPWKQKDGGLKRHFMFWMYQGRDKLCLLKLRKIPKKWIPEYDEMLKRAYEIRDKE